MKYSQERKPSAFVELSRAAELRPKQAVLAKLAPPHQGTFKYVAADPPRLSTTGASRHALMAACSWMMASIPRALA